MKVKVKVTGWKPIYSKWQRAIPKYAEKGMSDSMKDLGMVAQSMAPVDTHRLEDSVKTTVKAEGKTVVGTLEFSAYNKGFNYAVWTHEMAYNLGPFSSAKTPKRSKYGNYTGFVGTGYAIRPTIALAPSYAKHIGEVMAKGMR